MSTEGQKGRRERRGSAAAAGGVVAAFVASLCCIGPVVLAALGVGVGVTGFWATTVGVMKALLPYRPLFIGLALVCLVVGFYLVYRRPAGPCEPSGVCEQPPQSRVTRWLLWTLAGLAVALITAPYWLGL